MLVRNPGRESTRETSVGGGEGISQTKIQASKKVFSEFPAFPTLEIGRWTNRGTEGEEGRGAEVSVSWERRREGLGQRPRSGPLNSQLRGKGGGDLNDQ